MYIYDIPSDEYIMSGNRIHVVQLKIQLFANLSKLKIQMLLIIPTKNEVTQHGIYKCNSNYYIQVYALIGFYNSVATLPEPRNVSRIGGRAYSH